MKEERYITTPKFDALIKKIMKEQTQMDEFNKTVSRKGSS